MGRTQPGRQLIVTAHTHAYLREPGLVRKLLEEHEMRRRGLICGRDTHQTNQFPGTAVPCNRYQLG